MPMPLLASAAIEPAGLRAVPRTGLRPRYRTGRTGRSVARSPPASPSRRGRRGRRRDRRRRSPSAASRSCRSPAAGCRRRPRAGDPDDRSARRCRSLPTTTVVPPVSASHAGSTLIDDWTSPAGARRYHCPTAGPPDVPLTGGPASVQRIVRRRDDVDAAVGHRVFDVALGGEALGELFRRDAARGHDVRALRKAGARAQARCRRARRAPAPAPRGARSSSQTPPRLLREWANRSCISRSREPGHCRPSSVPMLDPGMPPPQAHTPRQE